MTVAFMVERLGQSCHSFSIWARIILIFSWLDTLQWFFRLAKLVPFVIISYFVIMSYFRLHQRPVLLLSLTQRYDNSI